MDTTEQRRVILIGLNLVLTNAAKLAHEYQVKGMPAMADQYVSEAETARKLINSIKHGQFRLVLQ